MVLKFVIFAVFCIAAVQVQGNGLEDQIKQGLAKLNSLTLKANRSIDQTYNDVKYKTKALKEKTTIFLQKETRMTSEIVKSLEAIAAAAEKNATENNRPPSTLECIRKVKTEAIKKIQAYDPSFKTDMNKLEKTKLASMETAAKPLGSLQTSVKEMNTKYQSLIKDSKDAKSLDKVLQDMEAEFKTVFIKTGEIERQLGKIFSDFNRDANFVFSIVSRQVNKIKGDAAEDIRKC